MLPTEDLEYVKMYHDDPRARTFIKYFRSLNDREPSGKEVRDPLNFWGHSQIHDIHYSFLDT